MPRKINFRSFIEVSIVIVSICSVALIVMQDQIFYARLLDISPNGVQRELGSGRLVFHLVSFQHLSDMSLLEFFLGIGRTNQLDLMYMDIGMSITSHNGFLDMLIQNGLIGLLLFVAYFKALWSAIQPSDNDRLIKGLFFMILGFQFLQGGFMFYFDFLFAILLLAQKNSQSSKPIKSLKFSK